MADEIKYFIKDEKEEAALKEINNNAVLYTKVFMTIYRKLCRHCLAKVHRKFLSKEKMSFEEYCPECKKMAEEEWNKWTS